MLKLFLGLLKGAVLGAAVGYGAFAAGLDGGFNWLTYGLIGALVGLIAGRPLWALITDKNSTTWISVLKAVFGFGVACGIYALVDQVWGGFQLTMSFLADRPRMFQHWQPVFGAAVGGFWGAFIEIDDAIGGDDAARSGDKVDKSRPVAKLPPAASRKRS